MAAMRDRVWIPVADADVWARATTVDVRDGDLVTLRRDGTDHTVQMTRAELEALPAAVLDEAVDDLTALSSVHDATMLDTLRRRARRSRRASWSPSSQRRRRRRSGAWWTAS